MTTPFDPPIYAGLAARQAYEQLRVICEAADPLKPKKINDARELFIIIQKTYYDLKNFSGITDDVVFCKQLKNAHWWQLHGEYIHWLIGVSIAVCGTILLLFMLWLSRKHALLAIDSGAVSGFASGVKLKRRIVKGAEAYKQRVQDKADQDKNSS